MELSLDELDILIVSLNDYIQTFPEVQDDEDFINLLNKLVEMAERRRSNLQ